MRMPSTDTFLTSILVLCAVVTTALVIRREVTNPTLTPLSNSASTQIEEWEKGLGQGRTIGPPDAPVRILEFADYQCPYCASLHSVLKAVRAKWADKVALTYAHFPLDSHNMAERAALASECAAEQGFFEPMHNEIFARQSALEGIVWPDLARAAGVTDLAGFDSCMTAGAPLTHIRESRDFALNTLSIRGTPTIIINGWKLVVSPTEAEFDQMIERVLKGEPPIRKTSWWRIGD